MKINTMLISRDLEKTKKFYCTLFQARVISDFGENITFTGGLSFQTVTSWAQFIKKPVSDIQFEGNNLELYFETEDIESFVKIIEKENIRQVHPLEEAIWGQRSIRVYDPDGYIIEIAEKLDMCVLRYHNAGWDIQKIVEKTFLSEGIINRMIKNAKKK